MKKGIDISSHNGVIDMEKIKKDEVEFLILRIGYGKKVDKSFYENYEKASKLGIPMGIYLYSYARNIEEAQEEAERVINLIENLKLEYPIFIDMEDADKYKVKNNVSYETCIDICEIFCDYIENKGYYVGIYASLDWLNNKINSSRLDKYDKWVAQWGKKCNYKKEYGIWQYSSEGKINGIKGNVDLNYSLKDYPTIIKENNLNKLQFEKNIYIVQEGDNLTKIAAKYNMDWKIIYELNKEIIGDNPHIIKAGQKLFIGDEE